MPVSTASSSAASATDRLIGPAVSWAAEIGTMPAPGTVPSVGFMPTTPLTAAGEMIEPSVSVPTASGASPAATAAPDPDDDPLGLRPRSCGLRVWPPTALHPLVEAVERKFAHSDRLVLPSTTAPAERSRVTSCASSGRESASAREPAVVGRPVTAMLSFTSTGTPSSARGGCVRRYSSLTAACSSASGSTASTAPTVGFTAAIRSRQLRVTSTELTSPAVRAACNSVAVAAGTSVIGRPGALSRLITLIGAPGRQRGSGRTCWIRNAMRPGPARPGPARCEGQGGEQAPPLRLVAVEQQDRSGRAGGPPPGSACPRRPCSPSSTTARMSA